MMEKLAGPDVKSSFCNIPPCHDATGCPSNVTRCHECVQFHGAHEKALKGAGCTEDEAKAFCDAMGKPPAAAVAGAVAGLGCGSGWCQEVKDMGRECIRDPFHFVWKPAPQV